MDYKSTRQYPYLPKGKVIKYASADNIFIKQAQAVSLGESTDDRMPTGAVAVKDGNILAQGANQSALKNKKLREFHKNYFCVRRLFGVPSGKMYWLCPGCASSSHHAEARVVSDAFSRNVSLKGSDVYLYGHWWCCKPCWDKMITAGIKDVYLVEGATEKFS